MLSLETLRRDAKRLRRAHLAEDPGAQQRLAQHPPQKPAPYSHADYLHVVAQENGFGSWPRLKLATDTIGLDRAARQQRLKIALAQGQNWVVEHLLAATPDLAAGVLGLEIALYDMAAVEAALQADPAAATRMLGPKSPMCHLAFSKWCHARPDLQGNMLAIADMLLAHGADVNDSMALAGSDHQLSALYGAIGHANNMALGKWLLEQGANPDDGESLYHATELGHHDGLKMLLEHGANPRGTNALYRAMDFHDVAAVRMLLEHGAKVEDYNGGDVGGEAPWVIPALFQAARRNNGAAMITLLLDHGANPEGRYHGASAYACARIYGNSALAAALAARGADTTLSEIEAHLARAAENEAVPGALRGVEIPRPFDNLIREILHLPGRMEHVQALVDLGIDPDKPDREGLTPVQISGWEGLPEMMTYLLSLGPDLRHINTYGGTLVSTILHGAENCPERDHRDHGACLTMALAAGALLTRNEMGFSGRADLVEIMTDWAGSHPDQVA